MVLDPTNLAVQGSNKIDRLTTRNTVNDQQETNDNSSETGQTSAVGPAVVSNISTAALETSRAVNAPEQAADENSAGDVVEEAARGQGQISRQQQAGQRSGIDIVV